MLLKTKNRVVVVIFPSLSPRPSLMAPSLSSLFLPNTFPSRNPNPNPNLTCRYIFPPCTRTQPLITFCTNSSPNPKLTTDSPPPPPPPPPPTPPPPSPSEKKSFAIATGELFLGLAARLISRGSDGIYADGSPVAMFERTTNGNGKIGYGKDRIANVVEDEIQPGVVWEQREKDVEAERERRVVTSPGFSFSAAGLLFPYHLGVAKFLIEKGYIKETTPLAGSSAGAIV